MLTAEENVTLPLSIAGRKPELWPTENVQRARELMAEAGYPNGQGFPVYDGAAIVMRTGQNPDRGTAIPPAPSFTSAVASFVIARTASIGSR